MLPKDHALAELKLEDGFAIQEQKLVQIDMTQAIARLPSETPEFVPLRSVVPATEGRLTPWRLMQHICWARDREWPGIKPFEFTGQTIAICGGGPSLGRTIPELRELKKSGAKIMAINRTHDYLINLPQTHKIPWVKPWAGILLEPTPNAASYIKPAAGVRYYIGSQCHPDTFDKFEKSEHYIWHAEARPEMRAALTREELKLMVPQTGSTCGLRAIMLAYMIGFTEIHLFGFDSCYAHEDIMNGKSLNLHAYHKPETIHDVKELLVRGFNDHDRTYYGNGNMLAQADEFQRFMAMREEKLNQKKMDPHQIYVHGEGLIPDMAREFGLHADSYYQRKRKAA